MCYETRVYFVDILRHDKSSHSFRCKSLSITGGSIAAAAAVLH